MIPFYYNALTFKCFCPEWERVRASEREAASISIMYTREDQDDEGDAFESRVPFHSSAPSMYILSIEKLSFFGATAGLEGGFVWAVRAKERNRNRANGARACHNTTYSFSPQIQKIRIVEKASRYNTYRSSSEELEDWRYGRIIHSLYAQCMSSKRRTLVFPL